MPDSDVYSWHTFPALPHLWSASARNQMAIYLDKYLLSLLALCCYMNQPNRSDPTKSRPYKQRQMFSGLKRFDICWAVFVCWDFRQLYWLNHDHPWAVCEEKYESPQFTLWMWNFVNLFFFSQLLWNLFFISVKCLHNSVTFIF